MSSSDDPSGTDKQPGGTLTAAGGSHVGRILESGEDSNGLGRWSWITLEGKNTNLYVATAYRVQQENLEGTKTSFAQQKKLLRKKGVENPNPRKQWLTDLSKQI